MKQPLLEKGKYYHIYNKGRLSEILFRENDNYEHFLRLYEKYINPVAETFAWVLMGNHFHLLLKTKEIETPKPLHQYFSNMFNAYTKAVNKRYDRYGPLFVSPFKRKEITDEIYLLNLVHYIHYNPVYHGFAKNPGDYRWSSFLTITSCNPTKLNRETVLSWFNDSIEEYKQFHLFKNDYKDTEKYVIE